MREKKTQEKLFRQDVSCGRSPIIDFCLLFLCAGGAKAEVLRGKFEANTQGAADLQREWPNGTSYRLLNARRIIMQAATQRQEP